jgi:hypothetical protein
MLDIPAQHFKQCVDRAGGRGIHRCFGHADETIVPDHFAALALPGTVAMLGLVTLPMALSN